MQQTYFDGVSDKKEHTIISDYLKGLKDIKAGLKSIIESDPLERTIRCSTCGYPLTEVDHDKYYTKIQFVCEMCDNCEVHENQMEPDQYEDDRAEYQLNATLK